MSRLVIVPPARAGMRIGLMGGSFDPPHKGHLALSREALKRLGLDQLWWLPTPGNPLKPDGPAPLPQRLTQCRRLADGPGGDPRIQIAAPEAALGINYSIDLVKWLRHRHGGVHFVWIMGGDNWAIFDRWRGWRQIAHMLPIAIFDRPGWRHKALAGRAAHYLAASRLPESRAGLLAARHPPAWVLLTIPLRPESSTALRQRHKSASL